MTAETIHTCSYECLRPECIRAQRDELVARLSAETSNARGEVRAVLEKAQWGLYVAWDAVAALEDLQKRGVYVPVCDDGKPSRADAGKDLETIKAAYETVKQALAAEGVQAAYVPVSALLELAVIWRRDATGENNYYAYALRSCADDITALAQEHGNGQG